ncbi:hypothetical protein QJ054_34145 [Streptomyces sp. AN-3]|uniref:hypothetical protein n=1 Tax=Streptomyces sp. AN-3 TaxID=3044177 RepID=UPI00249C3376|nr:hypothetical protein [Streptomyces sp. AN-3]MDI3102080.1 hypothetical protein [Streptomyces sp. AN-3]
MKGILHLVASGESDTAPCQRLHWSQVQVMSVDEAAWVQTWMRVGDQVRPLVAWQCWPEQLVRDWLGIDPPAKPPPLPENIQALLEMARPLLGTRS